MQSLDFSPFRYSSRQGAQSRWLANGRRILVGQSRGSGRRRRFAAHGDLASSAGVCFNARPHSCIQRGGGTGPLKPRQPSRPAVEAAGTVPIPSGSKHKAWEM